MRAALATSERIASDTPTASRRMSRYGRLPEGLSRLASPKAEPSACSWEPAVCAAAEATNAALPKGRRVPDSRGSGLPSEESVALPKNRRDVPRAERLVLANGHRVSRKRRTKPKFVQPEVWPTPVGRTDLDSLTKAETDVSTI